MLPMNGRSANPVCHPSSVKVDKDRQMVVLEEEFQVRCLGEWDPHPPQEVQGGTRGPKGLELMLGV